MASILGVDTIQNTSGTAVISAADDGTISIPKIHKDTANTVLSASTSSWEAIKAYCSASNSSLGTVSGSSNAAHINFEGVFASHYISYKLVIGWLNYHHSGNHSVNIRFLTGTNTELTAASYRWGLHRIESDATSYTANNNTSDDRIQIFKQTSSGVNETNVGFHGEVNFYNIRNVTLNGQSTSVRFDSTADYAPTIMSDLVGYDTDSGAYVRANGIGRYNVSNVDGYYTGFTLMGETGELAGSHMVLYGLRIS